MILIYFFYFHGVAVIRFRSFPLKWIFRVSPVLFTKRRQGQILQILTSTLKKALCGGRPLDPFLLQVSIKWMVERSTTDEALKEPGQGCAASTAEARQRTRQACDVLQLGLQTKHLSTKSLQHTSAAHLAPAFLQSVLFNIHRGYDLSGQRWTGTKGEAGNQPLCAPSWSAVQTRWKMRG